VVEPAKLRQNEAFLQQLRQLDPDLFIVAAYGKIIPAEYLSIPQKGGFKYSPFSFTTMAWPLSPSSNHSSGRY